MRTDNKDAARGLYEKFTVTRTDGRSAPGEKHEGCEYFVLDMDHDPFAAPALRAYAMACRTQYPALSRDLVAIVSDLEQRERGRILGEAGVFPSPGRGAV
jgi:hypothetical protein